MPNFIGSVQYRLQGNLFENKYYIQGADNGAAETALAEIITAMSVIQTADVEYVSALLTQVEGDHTQHPVEPPVVNGTSDARFTANGLTFLEFVFFSTFERGKTTHRIRGYNSDTAAALGVFNANTSGRGDQGNPSDTSVVDPGYAGYLAAVVTNSVNQNFQPLAASSRVSIGAKRATKRL
jgi:hypothetical protein